MNRNKTRAVWMAALLASVAGCQKSPEPAPKAAAAASAEDASQSGQDRAEQAGRALLGARAPAMTLTTIDGETIDLRKLYGKKPVYLKFWATWCTPCLEQMPHFEQHYEALGDRFAVIAVNTGFSETLEGVKAYRERHGLKMPIVIDDGRLAAALNLRVTPQHVVIDRSGRIVYVGHLADAKLEAALTSAEARAPSEAAPPQGQAPAQAAAAPTTGAPNVVPLLGGGAFPLRDPQGRRPTALLFFTPWCEGYLAQRQPETGVRCQRAREAAERLSAAGGARWLGVASGLWANTGDLGDYRKRTGAAIPLSLDATGALFRAYHVTAIPTVVVIGPDGRELSRHSGDLGQLESQLNMTREHGR
jgi:peroxiredoxin